jgi:VWFA-related protein
VANLTKEDFVVLDRGKPREISVFSVESSQSTTQAAQPLPQNTFSDLPQANSSAVRSITIVLLDNLNTLYGSAPQDEYESTPHWIEDLALQRARTQLLEFVKTLDPQDRVAIYGLRDSLHILCDFTSDRAQLLAIVSKYDTSSRTNRAVVEPAYRTAPLIENAPDPQHVRAENGAALRLAEMANEERAKITMAALASIANHVANIPGRKNLVWLTAELPFSGTAMARLLSPASIAVYPVDARGLLPQQVPSGAIMGTADADDVSGASGHLDNMPAQSSVPIGIPTMQKLAEETGGQAFVNTNDITGAIRKAVEDSAVNYTLGFYIEPNSLDGKFHELKIQVRPGLSVRYPKGYLALKDAPATQDDRRNNFLIAIKSPLNSSAIPLDVKADRVNQPTPNSLALSGSIGIHDIQFVQSGEIHTGALDISVVEQDETGKVLRQSGNRINLSFSEKQYPAVLKTGITFRKSVQPQAGATTLRVVVQDPATAAVGSLIIPLSQVK